MGIGGDVTHLAAVRGDLRRRTGETVMSGFSPEWLALRESHDLRARNPVVLGAVADRFRSRDSLNVVDLACGAGSTVRAIGPHLQARQHWDLVDNDPHLLALACGGNDDSDVRLNAVSLDLGGNFEAVLDSTKHLVTTSALLDLVSETWLDRLVRHIASRALPFYAALTYDGRTDFFPSDPLDEIIISAVNAHQRTDKGFGPALGPSAAAAAISRFEAAGYSVIQGRSDWQIGTADHEMQRALLSGWAQAAREIEALPHRDIDDWLARRNENVDLSASTMRVGHVDFFAVPMTIR
ncbi:hypothetical protein [Bradyrhizobium roseum]|uniref:hypothetical protein n=1 Tax=Bradyrhizobium roseum TaxID=3056648 RepID=UPI0026075F1E|nr:hypothetical protein [Bradyrhizobium roseus]WKA30520.1 hypothetical protein QUH67_10300 [Bradyrhizobium roseus]